MLLEPDTLKKSIKKKLFGIITEDNQFVNTFQVLLKAFPISMFSFVVFTGECPRVSPSLSHSVFPTKEPGSGLTDSVSKGEELDHPDTS